MIRTEADQAVVNVSAAFETLNALGLVTEADRERFFRRLREITSTAYAPFRGVELRRVVRAGPARESPGLHLLAAELYGDGVLLRWLFVSPAGQPRQRRGRRAPAAGRLLALGRRRDGRYASGRRLDPRTPPARGYGLRAGGTRRATRLEIAAGRHRFELQLRAPAEPAPGSGRRRGRRGCRCCRCGSRGCGRRCRRRRGRFGRGGCRRGGRCRCGCRRGGAAGAAGAAGAVASAGGVAGAGPGAGGAVVTGGVAGSGAASSPSSSTPASSSSPPPSRHRAAPHPRGGRAGPHRRRARGAGRARAACRVALIVAAGVVLRAGGETSIGVRLRLLAAVLVIGAKRWPLRRGDPRIMVGGAISTRTTG